MRAVWTGGKLTKQSVKVYFPVVIPLRWWQHLMARVLCGSWWLLNCRLSHEATFPGLLLSCRQRRSTMSFRGLLCILDLNISNDQEERRKPCFMQTTLKIGIPG